MKIETVKVKHADGFCIINKSDFDTAKHDLYVEEQQIELVDLNSATQKDLAGLPGVNTTKARVITRNRPYESIEDAQKKLNSLEWDRLKDLVEVK